MQVYLVEDQGNCPGRIYGVFAHENDAEKFIEAMEACGYRVGMIPRTLIYGQALIGMNE